jgi:hypothetical protein
MVGRFVRPAGFFQQADKLRELFRGKVTELLVVAFADLVSQLIEQFRARCRDPDFDDAAILGPALPLDKLPLFEAVEQAGHVRRPRNEPRAKRERGNGAGLRSAQQAQGVVLLRREIVLLEQLLFERLEAVVGPPEVEVGFLFRRVEAFSRRLRGGCRIVHPLEGNFRKAFELGSFAGID